MFWHLVLSKAKGSYLPHAPWPGQYEKSHGVQVMEPERWYGFSGLERTAFMSIPLEHVVPSSNAL